MPVPLAIDNLKWARRLYHWAQYYRDYYTKWPYVKAAMEREFPGIIITLTTYPSMYGRLKARYGLSDKPNASYLKKVNRRPLSELFPDGPPDVIAKPCLSMGPPQPDEYEVETQSPDFGQDTNFFAKEKHPLPDPDPEPSFDPTERPGKSLGTLEQELLKGVNSVQVKQTMDEYKRILNDRSRTEIICEAIREALRPLSTIPDPPPYSPIVPGMREYTALLMFGDLQIGQYTRKDETGGLIEYSTEIFYERLANLERLLIQRIVEMRKAYTIRDLFIAGLGDFVENETIFEGQKSNIDSNVMDQFLNGARVIGDMLYRLQSWFEGVRFVGVPGNHGRIGKKGEANIFTNWDYILYELLKARLAGQPRISIEPVKSWWTIEQVRNSKFMLTHGDNIKAWNTIPYYGFDRADARQTMLLQGRDLEYNYWLTGHHHNPASVDRPNGGERIINGAFPGGSIYSARELTTASQPSQTLLFVGDKRVDWIEKLRIGEVE